MGVKPYRSAATALRRLPIRPDRLRTRITMNGGENDGHGEVKRVEDRWLPEGAVVGLLKVVSAKEIREEFPEVRKQLWGGEFWEDGYFVRTVGDKVTAEVIKKYIRFHEAKKRGAEQLDLF